MPTISIFYGILIQMYWMDHAPPHFHALYGEFEIIINILTLEIIKGKMPHRALALIRDWAGQHQNELIENWKLCQLRQIPYKIPPLE
jgi:hypothetical protein